MSIKPDQLDALDTLSRVEHLASGQLAAETGWCNRKARAILSALVADLAVDVDTDRATSRGRGHRYRITGRGRGLLAQYSNPGDFPKAGR